MLAWIEQERRIPREIVQRCAVKQEKDVLVFECLQDGKLVNRQYRTKDKKIWLEKGAQSGVLWNAENVHPERRELVITEGQFDAMAVMSWGHDAVVSMPAGVNSLSWIDERWDWLERFDTYFLMTDEDSAGGESAKAISRRLPNCRRVRLGHKDANDALRAGMTSEQFLERYSMAEWMDAHLLRTAESYEGDLLTPRPPGRPTPWPRINGAFGGGVQVPSVNVIAGPNGAGKSTAVLQLVVEDLASEDPLVTVVSSNELPVRESLEKMIRQTRRTPSERSNREFFEQTTRHNLYLLDLVDVVSEDELFEYFELGARRYGARLFVIDSISRLDMPNGEDSNSREKAFINRCVQFTRRHQAIIWIVSHIRKSLSDDAPFGKVDVKGSGALTDLADNVFGYRRLSSEKAKQKGYDSFLWIMKNRMTGKQWGVGLKYQPSFDRLEEVENAPSV